MGDLKDNHYSPRHRKQKYICYSDTLAVRYGDTMNGYIQFPGLVNKIPLHDLQHSNYRPPNTPHIHTACMLQMIQQRTRLHSESRRSNKLWILNDWDEYCHLTRNTKV